MNTVPRLTRGLRRPHLSCRDPLAASVRSLWAALVVVLSTAAGFAQSGAVQSNAIPDLATAEHDGPAHARAGIRTTLRYRLYYRRWHRRRSRR